MSVRFKPRYYSVHAFRDIPFQSSKALKLQNEYDACSRGGVGCYGTCGTPPYSTVHARDVHIVALYGVHRRERQLRESFRKLTGNFSDPGNNGRDQF